ncbi:hypothetical protein F5Y17DRAFT_453697, partial [Xylariaceae sp. FL0594]
MHGKGFDFALKWFAAPVVTQLFFYMADKISYTATYIQARLLSSSTFANPSVVYYSVCVPNLHVMGDDDDWLYCTAVAQVFLVLQALCLPPLLQDW